MLAESALYSSLVLPDSHTSQLEGSSLNLGRGQPHRESVVSLRDGTYIFELCVIRIHQLTVYYVGSRRQLHRQLKSCTL